jgi:hypothetical protein
LGLFALAGPLEAREELSSLRTIAEKTGYRETGRYLEAVEFCRALEKRFSSLVVCKQWGLSPEGRPLLAVIAGIEARKPKRARKLPVLYAQGGIHAGEIDGKDAGFKILRELLSGSRHPGILKRLTFVFVPVLNVDGHERFGPNHRPNQNGPEKMGWRVNSQNLNLNRDFLKVDSPELRQLHPFWREWDPIVSLDLHVTDGADFENQLGLIIAPSLPQPQPERRELAEVGVKLRAQAMARMRERKILAVDFYPSFKNEEDPMSGFEEDIAGPRYSQGYWSTSGRIGVLVETHSWKPYAMRVDLTVEALDFFLGKVAEEGAAWMSLAKKQEARLLSEWPKKIGLSFVAGPQDQQIEFPGVAYTKKVSEVSGAQWIQYERSKPQTWKVPYASQVLMQSKTVLQQSTGGYWVEAGFAEQVLPVLQAHGISVQRIEGRWAGDRACEDGSGVTLSLQGFRVKSVDWSRKSYEGRQGVKLLGQYQSETRRLQVGDLFVPWAQPKLGVAVALFEPESKESLASWGFFNSRLERREYMEDYVAESEARRILSAESGVRQEFEKRLQESAEFRASPSERLDFFYQRHPSWDSRLDLLPVYRWEGADLSQFITSTLAKRGAGGCPQKLRSRSL